MVVKTNLNLQMNIQSLSDIISVLCIEWFLDLNYEKICHQLETWMHLCLLKGLDNIKLTMLRITQTTIDSMY